MLYEDQMAYIWECEKGMSGEQLTEEEVEELLQRDTQNRETLTSFQLAELDDEEVVDDTISGWALTFGGIYIAQDGERLFGQGSGREPGDEADLRAVGRCS